MVTSDVRATVVVYDPIRMFPWSYAVERAALETRGVDFQLPVDRDEARRLLPLADVVVVSQRFPVEDMNLLERCCGILCYSIGKDGVDATRAAGLGITVTNVPDYCTEEVSDHGVALLLALQRLVVAFATEGAAGRWNVRDWPEFMTMRRLSTQVVGVVGTGRIGSRMAAKAQGLGMATIGHDPFVPEPPIAGLEMVGFDELLARSDAVVLCAALTDGSRDLMDAAAFARMRQGAVLVNVARGGLVDETALAEALRTGHLRGAALDVRATEPTDPAVDPLLGFRNVILTQHVGATSIEAWEDMHVLASARILDLLQEGGRIAAGSTAER